MIRLFWKVVYDLSMLLPVFLLATYIYHQNLPYFALYLLLTIFISLASITYPFLFKRFINNDTLSIASISPYDSFFECLTTYSLPLLSLLLGLEPHYFTLMILLICVLLAYSSTGIPNPVFRMLGFHFYKIDLDNGVGNLILISKRNISECKDVSAGKLISDYLIMDTDA